MIVYKLTDENMKTYNNCQWKLNEIKEVRFIPELSLCTHGWIHAYESPEIAVLNNNMHGQYHPFTMRLFKADTLDSPKAFCGHSKLGSTKMVLLKELPVPQPNLLNWKFYAILSLRAMFTDLDWIKTKVYGKEGEQIIKTFLLWSEDFIENKNNERDLLVVQNSEFITKAIRIKNWKIHHWDLRVLGWLANILTLPRGDYPVTRRQGAPYTDIALQCEETNPRINLNEIAIEAMKMK